MSVVKDGSSSTLSTIHHPSFYGCQAEHDLDMEYRGAGETMNLEW